MHNLWYYTRNVYPSVGYGYFVCTAMPTTKPTVASSSTLNNRCASERRKGKANEIIVELIVHFSHVLMSPWILYTAPSLFLLPLTRFKCNSTNPVKNGNNFFAHCSYQEQERTKSEWASKSEGGWKNSSDNNSCVRECVFLYIIFSLHSFIYCRCFQLGHYFYCSASVAAFGHRLLPSNNE